MENSVCNATNLCEAFEFVYSDSDSESDHESSWYDFNETLSSSIIFIDDIDDMIDRFKKMSLH
jgi:hypothetical protein